MSDISIQFHALPSDLVPLVKEFVSERQLHVVGMSFPPFSAMEIPNERIEQALLDGRYRRFAFTEEKPVSPIASQKQFGERHPCALILDVGRQSSSGLEQSRLACRTLDLPMPNVWRGFAQRLRSVTTAGAVAINPDTGATALMPNFRYTLGAKTLSQSGVPMLSAAGGTILKLGTA